MSTRILSLWLALIAFPFAVGAKEAVSNHWAFRPPVRLPLPSVKNSSWVRTPIDAFILAELETSAITPSVPASRRVLIRRVYFDLLGLPPTPEEVETFVNDDHPHAYPNLIERLLKSPHYGERWGRHWLDAAGYADSNGYFDADTDRPLAYKYRDYVIRSFNSDKPMDQFIREQIAGDELAGYQPGTDVTSDTADLLIATHFLRNAPDGTGESDGNPNEQRVDRYAVLEGTVQLMGAAFLGITVQCARCHDHKFEPFTQEEYYGLQAILRPVYDPEKWVKPNDRVVTVGSREEKTKAEQLLKGHEREIKALKDSIEALVKPARKALFTEKLKDVPEAERAELEKAFDTKPKERSSKMKELLGKYPLLDIKDEEIKQRFPEIVNAQTELQAALKRREKDKPAGLPQIAAAWETTIPAPEHHLLIRGLHAKTGPAVKPLLPSALSSGEAISEGTAQSSGSSGRRTALANWLCSPQHPTVSRLLVNRVWLNHFGRGLLPNADNLGLSGGKPSHPALLDWLATELVGNGWSMKHLHRMILLSSTYQQSSAPRESINNPDPDNHLFGGFPLRRMDAESLRDATFAVTGELDRTMFGAYTPRSKTAEGQYIVNEKEPGAWRRSLYLQQKRGGPVTLLDLFDLPRLNPNCSQRSMSTVPLQSLALLNSDFARARAKAFAGRVRGKTNDVDGRLDYAFMSLSAGLPGAEERKSAKDFLQDQTRVYNDKKDAEELAWADLCQMLLASNGFLYIE